MKPIYLDYNATTPVDPEVAASMRPFLMSGWGNPSSSHIYGKEALAAIDAARGKVAALLGCQADEIVFTSGGSESNNMAIKGVVFARPTHGGHIITSQVEHPAVAEVCAYLSQKGFAVTFLPVDGYGMVSAASVAAAIRPNTILITIMHANNETGTIQPIAEIGKLARKHGICFHSDAAQSVGKISVQVNDLDVDLLSIAGHKIYMHKGIGVLYVRRGVKLEKFIHGAAHEHNRRAGTENTLHIVGMGTACEIAGRDLSKTIKRMKRLRDQLFERLVETIPDIRLNGHPRMRLPNTFNVSFGNCDAAAVLGNLTDVAASAGAACHSSGVLTSATLSAMNVPTAYIRGAIRFSIGKMTTEDDIHQAAEYIRTAVETVRVSTPSEQL